MIQQKADGGTGGQVHFVGFLMGLLIVAVDQIRNTQALLIDSVQRYIDRSQRHILIGKSLRFPILSESKEVKPRGRIRIIAILGLCVDDYSRAICPAREKEGHYTMVKGSIPEEDITIVSVCAPNTGAPQCVRRTLIDIKGETDITQ